MPLICASYIPCTHYPEPTNLDSCLYFETCVWCPQENLCVDDCYASCANASFGEGCIAQLHFEEILNIVVPCIIGVCFLAIIAVIAVCIWKPEARGNKETLLYVEPECESAAHV